MTVAEARTLPATLPDDTLFCYSVPNEDGSIVEATQIELVPVNAFGNHYAAASDVAIPEHLGDLADIVLSLVLAISLLIPISACAQTAEAPLWKVGDKWTFHAKSRPPDKESNWSRQVLAILPNGHVSVATDEGRNLEFDTSGNSLDKRGPEYTWQRFRFPMTVGMKWSHERKIEGDTWHGQEQSSWEVKAYEKVTVPAGTFDCFKVSGEAYRTWDSTTSVAKGYMRGYNLLTYWYCPAIKWVARWEGTDNAYVTAPMAYTASELSSFESRP